MTEADEIPVLALVRDLMFSSKITATARAAGQSVKVFRDPAQLDGAGGKLLVVDLNQHGAVEAASGWRKQSNGVVVGFVSHVDAGTILKARSAGIDRVLARSQFVRMLPDLLGGKRADPGRPE